MLYIYLFIYCSSFFTKKSAPGDLPLFCTEASPVPCLVGVQLFIEWMNEVSLNQPWPSPRATYIVSAQECLTWWNKDEQPPLVFIKNMSLLFTVSYWHFLSRNWLRGQSGWLHQTGPRCGHQAISQRGRNSVDTRLKSDVVIRLHHRGKGREILWVPIGAFGVETDACTSRGNRNCGG